MKAVVITKHGGPEVLEYRDVPDPVAGPDDLLVAVKATALNRADVIQRMGGYPQPGPKPEFDVPGLEFAGEVIEAGARVEGFARGDRVMGLLAGQAYAERVAIHHRVAMKAPASLSWHEAGAIPEVYITAHDALSQCALVAGESVLVHAVGSGVGVAAVQNREGHGASFVAGTAGSDEKLARSKELGLDLGIDYHAGEFAPAVLDATAGRGVDVVLDVIGAQYWDQNMRALAQKGRLVLVGLMGGPATQVNLGALMGKRLQVRGTTLRARPLEEKAAATRAFEKSVLPPHHQRARQGRRGPRLPARRGGRSAPLPGIERELRQGGVGRRLTWRSGVLAGALAHARGRPLRWPFILARSSPHDAQRGRGPVRWRRGARLGRPLGGLHHARPGRARLLFRRHRQ